MFARTTSQGLLEDQHAFTDEVAAMKQAEKVKYDLVLKCYYVSLYHRQVAEGVNLASAAPPADAVHILRSQASIFHATLVAPSITTFSPFCTQDKSSRRRLSAMRFVEHK
jgi:hypothetical protein